MLTDFLFCYLNDLSKTESPDILGRLKSSFSCHWIGYSLSGNESIFMNLVSNIGELAVKLGIVGGGIDILLNVQAYDEGEISGASNRSHEIVHGGQIVEGKVKVDPGINCRESCRWSNDSRSRRTCLSC